MSFSDAIGSILSSIPKAVISDQRLSLVDFSEQVSLIEQQLTALKIQENILGLFELFEKHPLLDKIKFSILAGYDDYPELGYACNFANYNMDPLDPSSPQMALDKHGMVTHTHTAEENEALSAIYDWLEMLSNEQWDVTDSFCGPLFERGDQQGFELLLCLMKKGLSAEHFSAWETAYLEHHALSGKASSSPSSLSEIPLPKPSIRL